MAIAPLPTPLASRLATLPLVLAGPFLRLVQPDQVVVWIALQKSASLTLKVLDANKQTLFTGTANTIKVGNSLHLALVVARPTGSQSPLSVGTVYYYDISFGSAGSGLDAAGVLTMGGGVDALETYVAYQVTGKPLLPAFSLPPASINTLKLAHGSCRKPHSFDLDALRTVDILLTTTAHDPVNRIHQLFMTGDQIYADDVAAPLLRMVTDAGDALIGVQEPLPGFSNNPTFSATLLPGQRQSVVAKMQPDGGGPNGNAFTSGAASSHLLSLGEFFGMYLMAWSDILWPSTLPTVGQTYDLNGAHPSDEAYAVELTPLLAFKRSLPRIRKVMANVPTYTIYDDHEITDDWYLHRRWTFRVFDKPLARRIIQNGLVAYALFQGWGNTPDRFSGSTPGAALFTEVQGWVQDGLSLASSHLAGIQSRLPLPTGKPNAALDDVALSHTSNQVRFDYTLTWPTHNVVALDTRTWRAYRKSDDMHVALFTQTGLDSQLGSLPTAITGGLTIVLLAGPAWMPPAFEQVLDTVTVCERISYGTDGKLEGLSQDVFSYENVLSRLAYAPVAANQPQQVRYLILSGDVHMGLATRLQYWSNKAIGASAAQPAQMVFANVTSSGLKHEVELTLRLHKIGFKIGKSPQADVVRLVWDVADGSQSLVVANVEPAVPSPATDAGKLGAPVDTVAKMALIADRNAIASQYLTMKFAPANGSDGSPLPEPTRQSVLRFISSTLQRIGPADINQIDTVPSGNDPATRSAKVQALQATKKNAADNIDNSAPGKQLIGKHNVGVLTFSGFGTDSPVVTQELRWWRQDGSLLHALETDATEIVADAISHQEISLAFDAKPTLDK